MRKAFQVCLNHPWLITQDMLLTILAVANREGLDVAAVETQLGRKLDNTRSVTERNGVAIIPVTGPIFRYANLFSEISGATSIEILARDFTTALNNPDVQGILLNIDSPGGEANGIAEFANMVYAAREKKPIWAYVGGYGASAAYWIASAAEQIVADESALLGSIGTIAAVPDPAVEHEGEVILVSRQSPRKHADPTTKKGASDILDILDALTGVFVDAVARNRGITSEAVLSDFGQGGLFVGQAAVDAGLCDRLGSFEATLAEMCGQRQMGMMPAQARALSVLSAAGGPLGHRSTTPKESPIMEETQNGVPPSAAPPPAEPALPVGAGDQVVTQALSGLGEQLTARQMEMLQARFTEMQRQANLQAEQMFVRWQAEQEQRQRIMTYAQDATSASLNRPHALPFTAEEVVTFLSALPVDARKTAQGMFDRILTSGLVSFEEIGSAAEGEGEQSPKERFDAAVAAKVGTGMSQLGAIQAVQKEQPDLYAAYSAASSRRGQVAASKRGGK